MVKKKDKKDLKPKMARPKVELLDSDKTTEMLEHISKYTVRHGRALLHDLVLTGSYEELEKYLVELEGWVYKLFQNETLMEAAMQHGSLECARVILRIGGEKVLVLTGNPKLTMLMHAIEAGSEKCVRFLLHHNLRLFSEPHSPEHSPLHLCVNTFVRPRLLRAVLEKIVHVNNCDVNGWTPLMCAIELQNVGAAIALIEDNRVDVAHAPKGVTPLHRAVMNGNTQVVSAMAKRHDVKTLCSVKKHKLLLDAITMKHGDVLAILLKTAGFTTSFLQFGGEEPLSHYAAGVGMLKTVMTHDTSFNCMIEMENGNTLVHVLATQYYTEERLPEFLRVISESPPSLAMSDCPVVLAARGGWPMEVFKAFLERGYTFARLCFTVQMNGLAPFDRRSSLLVEPSGLYWFLRSCAGELPIGGHVPMNIELPETQTWTPYECACYGGVPKQMVDHLLQLVAPHGFLSVNGFVLAPTVVTRKVVRHIKRTTKFQTQLITHGRMLGGWTPCFHHTFAKAAQERVHLLFLVAQRAGLPSELTQLILSYMPRTIEE
jgi:hypothetical protein